VIWADVLGVVIYALALRSIAKVVTMASGAQRNQHELVGAVILLAVLRVVASASAGACSGELSSHASASGERSFMLRLNFHAKLH